jgi:hypothetical protein
MRKRAALPPLASDPPAVRLTNQSAMRSTWRDPEDTSPSAARTAREIAGYRQFDPLRRCVQRHKDRCGITEAHIIAADVFRRIADGAVIGFSVHRDHLLPVSSIHYRPSTGPTSTARRQSAAGGSSCGQWPCMTRKAFSCWCTPCCLTGASGAGAGHATKRGCQPMQAPRCVAWWPCWTSWQHTSPPRWRRRLAEA